MTQGKMGTAMSYDLYIYMKHPENFSGAGFSEYCKGFGLKVTVPTAFSLTMDNHLFAMRVDDSRFTKGKDSSEFTLTLVLDPGAGVNKPRHRTLRLWERLFRTKRAVFLDAIKETKTVWRICGCSVCAIDSLTAFLLGGYLVKDCGGILEVPLAERYFLSSEQLDPVASEIMKEILSMAEDGTLKV